jgi:glyoxylase-like metal-dependent hydrolase (beta-lactamase superfamily II)/rhodanese-related sulfurtransferase
MDMEVERFATPGLGDNTFLIISGDEAAVVDPQRDAWRFLPAAESRGARVLAVLETHRHNDYVSGAHEIRAATGAHLVLPARGRYEFAHQPADEGHEVRIGDLRLVAVATPGHTFEHLAWLLFEDDPDTPVAVLSGGSLLVGSAGRTDLLGPQHTRELTHAQFESIRRLAALPDAVQVLPTHGAGSFCVAAAAGATPTTTVGQERRQNPLLTARDEDAFTSEITTELMAYPAYYAQMSTINRAGAAVLHRLPEPPALTVAAMTDRAAAGTWIIDTRDRHAFAAGHLPGSLNIELGAGFATYLGWMLPFDAPIALVLPEPQQLSLTEAITQLIRIGWSHVEGHLAGGVRSWTAAGEGLRAYPTADVRQLCEAFGRGQPPPVLDVRQEVEWSWGTIPGSTTLFLADLPAHLGHLSEHVSADEPTWVICSTGQRAAIAASFLDRADIPVCLVDVGGVGEWRQLCGDVGAEASEQRHRSRGIGIDG